jgi:flagellin
MSSISAVSGYSNYSAYSVISNGGQISKASQGASELAMQEKTDAQVRGLEVGRENLESARSVLNIEDGAMEGITDYLQNIKELSVKAMNGTLSDDDKQSIQSQVKEYLQGINDTANQAKYNEKNLLSGNAGDLKVATDSNGSLVNVSTYNSTTKALGIDDYDVTKDDFDMSRIDKALEAVTKNRSNAGAQTNAVEHALTYNSHAAMELNGYQMDKEEDNSMRAVIEAKQKELMDTYQNTLLAQKMRDDEQKAMNIFA